MMARLLEFFTYDIAWWLWLPPAIIFAAGIFMLVVRVFGLRRALESVGAFALVVFAFLIDKRGRQIGWKDRIKKEERDAEKLREGIKDARVEPDYDADGSLYDDDGFRID